MICTPPKTGYGMVMNTATTFPIIPNRIKIQGNTVNTSLLATCNTHTNGIWKTCTYKIIIMKVYQIGDRNRRHICWLSLLL
jgi:hypothetical protein